MFKQSSKLMRLQVVLPVVLLVLFASATWKRNAVYRDPVRLWNDAVAKSPEKSRCHNNLGLVLKERNLIPEALDQFEKAVELLPDNVYALNNLATLYCSTGKREQCGALLERAVRAKPEYTAARYNLAMYYYEAGRIRESCQEYSRIVQTDPFSREAQFAGQMLRYIEGCQR